MDNQMLGALIGFAVALVSYFPVGQIIRQLEARAGNNRDPKLERSIRILNFMRISEFFWLPAFLYFLFGSMDGPILG